MLMSLFNKFRIICFTRSRSLLDLLLCKFAFWVLSMWLGRFDPHIIVASLCVTKKYHWIEMLSAWKWIKHLLPEFFSPFN